MVISYCKKCLLHDGIPGVTLSGEKVCNFCETVQHPELKGMDALKGELDKARANNPDCKYDCVVGLSGGRDSTWIMHIASKILGLRILAFNNDNGFAPEETVRNIEKAVKYAGADLIRYSTPHNLAVKTTANLYKALIPHGPGALMKEICAPCNQAAAAAALKTIVEHKVPIGLDGRSEGEQVAFDTKTTSGIGRKAMLMSPRAPYYIKSLVGKYKIWKNLRLPGQTLRNRITFVEQLEQDAPFKLIKLFDYIPWDRKELKRTLLEEMDWKRPPGCISTWRTDCKMVPLVNYIWRKHYGLTKLEEGFAHMIRLGQMDRDDAIAQIEEIKPGEWSDHHERFCLDTLKLSGKDVDTMRGWPDPPDGCSSTIKPTAAAMV